MHHQPIPSNPNPDKSGAERVMVFVYDDSDQEIDRFKATPQEADDLNYQLPEGWYIQTEETE